VRLSDGDMALETWFDLPLRGTRLVVLSACDTGRVADHGTPLLAFQSALLAAGVQTVLGSLWQAHDSVTALLMEAFYRAWLAGKSPAAALRAAQYTLCANPATEHPALWASFICSGPAAFSLRNPSEK
jgi:CHAT domain-containing protein